MGRTTPLTSADASAREAWRHIAELFFGEQHQNRFLNACASADLSPPQLKALLSLEPGVGQPMRTLAESLRCDASWVTGIVDGLEQQGFAARRPHPTDRRVKVVEITELGEKAKATALETLYEPPPGIERLTDAEQRTLSELVRKIVEPNAGS